MRPVVSCTADSLFESLAIGLKWIYLLTPLLQSCWKMGGFDCMKRSLSADENDFCSQPVMVNLPALACWDFLSMFVSIFVYDERFSRQEVQPTFLSAGITLLLILCSTLSEAEAMIESTSPLKVVAPKLATICTMHSHYSQHVR